MFSVSLLTRMSTRNFQATPKKMSKVSVPATPKKMFKASIPADFSSCRLCKAVGDRTRSKNLFSRSNRPLLAAAEDFFVGSKL